MRWIGKSDFWKWWVIPENSHFWTQVQRSRIYTLFPVVKLLLTCRLLRGPVRGEGEAGSRKEDKCIFYIQIAVSNRRERGRRIGEERRWRNESITSFRCQHASRDRRRTRLREFEILMHAKQGACCSGQKKAQRDRRRPTNCTRFPNFKGQK